MGMTPDTGDFKMPDDVKEVVASAFDCDWAVSTGTPIPERPVKKRPGFPAKKRKKKPWEK